MVAVRLLAAERRKQPHTLLTRLLLRTALKKQLTPIPALSHITDLSLPTNALKLRPRPRVTLLNGASVLTSRTTPIPASDPPVMEWTCLPVG